MKRYEQNGENFDKNWSKNWEVKKFVVSLIFQTHFQNIDINEWVDVIASQFLINFEQEIDKNPTFQL